MAKFCIKCGKELVDGKCATCSTKKEVVTVENVDIKESFMDCLDVVKNIFTKPFEAIKKFVCEEKYVAGIIMTVMAALSAAICKIATIKSVESSNSASSLNLNDIYNLYKGSSSNEPEYLKEFMTTFAKTFAEYALIIVIGWLVVTKLFKGTASFKEMINAVAVSLATVLVAYLLNSILVFIDGEVIGYIRSYVSSIGYILSILVLCGALKEKSGVDSNRLYISVAFMSVGATMVMDIFNKIFN